MYTAAAGFICLLKRPRAGPQAERGAFTGKGRFENVPVVFLLDQPHGPADGRGSRGEGRQVGLRSRMLRTFPRIAGASRDVRRKFSLD